MKKELDIEAVKKRLNAALTSEDFISITVLESLNDIGLLIEAIAERDRMINRFMGFIDDNIEGITKTSY